LIRPVTDRPGHDRRYSLDCGKLRQLGWQPEVAFEAGLRSTVEWYRGHEAWWRPIKEQSPAFRDHYQRHYRG
jgi:dTDP-glucose 4,6-dehydratase